MLHDWFMFDFDMRMQITFFIFPFFILIHELHSFSIL